MFRRSGKKTDFDNASYCHLNITKVGIFAGTNFPQKKIHRYFFEVLNRQQNVDKICICNNEMEQVDSMLGINFCEFRFENLKHVNSIIVTCLCIFRCFSSSVI